MELLITKTTLLTGTLHVLGSPAFLFSVNSELLTFRKSNMLILISQWLLIINLLCDELFNVNFEVPFRPHWILGSSAWLRIHEGTNLRKAWHYAVLINATFVKRR